MVEALLQVRKDKDRNGTDIHRIGGVPDRVEIKLKTKRILIELE